MTDVKALVTEMFDDNEFFMNTIVPLFKNGFENVDYALPGATGVGVLIKKQAKYVVACGSTRYNGAKPWENGVEALSETSGYLQDKIYSMLLSALFRGYLIGSEAEKWRSMTRTECAEAMLDPEFLAKQNELCTLQSNDEKFLETISNKLTEILMSCCHSMGHFQDAEGYDTLRVWDAWYHTLEAAGHGFHIYGYEAGVRLSTESEFYSIVGLDLSTTEN